MHPVLITLPNGFALHTYGIAIAVGTVLAVLIASRWGTQAGMPKDTFADLGFWAIVAAVAGARLEYLRVNWALFDGAGLGRMLNVRDGGLVFYGGLIGVMVATTVLVRARGLRLLPVLDIVAPLIPFGLVFGRLGCFAAGCCYGQVTEQPWGVVFTDPLAIAPKGVPLHPTQLYEVGYSALLMGLLLWMRPRKRFDGQLILTFLSLYPVLRSLNELLRGDFERGWFLPRQLGQLLTNAQAISLLIATLAAVGWVALYRERAGRAPRAAPR